MDNENLEQRIAKLERVQRKTVEFCAILFARIHQLDKNMGGNLGQMADAIKDPAGFDIEDFQKQIARADFNFDQMSATLADLDQQ